MEENKVSIIIPNYFMDKPGKIVPDGDEELWFAENCFEMIKKHTKIEYELVLIDNGCVHGRDLLERYADKLVINEKNQGFAKACNQGFRVSSANWICFMNNDVFVWEGWIEALMQTFTDNHNCGVAMPALMKQTKNGKEALKFDTIDLSQNYGVYSEGAEFGSCWLTKREILERVGLFDENFKCGFGEDRDMWRRMRRAGYQTYRTHKTRVFHQGGVTMMKITDRKKDTIPNRIYLQGIIDEELKLGRSLTSQERDKIRQEVDIIYA